MGSIAGCHGDDRNSPCSLAAERRDALEIIRVRFANDSTSAERQFVVAVKTMT
jgi:hypothetical protein